MSWDLDELGSGLAGIWIGWDLGDRRVAHVVGRIQREDALSGALTLCRAHFGGHREFRIWDRLAKVANSRSIVTASRGLFHGIDFHCRPWMQWKANRRIR